MDEGKNTSKAEAIPNGPGRRFSDSVTSVLQDMVAELSQEAAFLCRAEALVVKDSWHVKSVASS